jgi:hypothetical protein
MYAMAAHQLAEAIKDTARSLSTPLSNQQNNLHRQSQQAISTTSPATRSRSPSVMKNLTLQTAIAKLRTGAGQSCLVPFSDSDQLRSFYRLLLAASVNESSGGRYAMSKDTAAR